MNLDLILFPVAGVVGRPFGKTSTLCCQVAGIIAATRSLKIYPSPPGPSPRAGEGVYLESA